MNTKKTSFGIISISFAFVVALAGLHLFVDPYQIFHRSFFKVTIPEGNDRHKAAGLINSVLAVDKAYDAIVIGTSYEMGYDTTRIQERLHTGKVLNLSIAGGFAKEKRLVLLHALRTGKVRFVFWGMFKDYADKNTENVNPLAVLPESFFSDRASVEDILRYLLGFDTLKQTLVVARGWGLHDISHLHDWNPAAVRKGLFEAFNTPESLKEETEVVARAKPQIAAACASWTPDAVAVFPSVDKNILDVAAKHPETQFRLVFGPLSLAFFHTLSGAELTQQMALREYVAKKAARYPNVRVYGFETDVEVTGNLANYRDSAHYSFHANNRVIDAIAEDRGRLTPENVDGYVRDLLSKIRDYEVYSDRAASLWNSAPAEERGADGVGAATGPRP